MRTRQAQRRRDGLGVVAGAMALIGALFGAPARADAQPLWSRSEVRTRMLAGQPRELDQTWSELGTSVAAAGDVNGDGYADVIVSAPYFQPTAFGADRGRVYVFLGGPAGLAATPAWTVTGDQDYARFGLVVAGAGDVNGDGFDDVIIGAPFYDHGAADTGRATVYLGSAAGLGATPAWTIYGDAAGALLGAVAGAGDVNGDGYA
ncbi:MAG TPA: integrin alpha, partial [Polyangia bacterium]